LLAFLWLYIRNSTWASLEGTLCFCGRASLYFAPSATTCWESVWVRTHSTLSLAASNAHACTGLPLAYSGTSDCTTLALFSNVNALTCLHVPETDRVLLFFAVLSEKIRNAKELVRSLINGLRSSVSVAALFAAFGRICDKFVFSHRCRNDAFSDSKDKLVLVSLVLNAVLVPIVKMMFELTVYARRAPPEILWSRSDEWRRRLLLPTLDAFLTLTPLLGALLVPEGFQESEVHVHCTIILHGE
jgi:hypothetical protein